MDDPRTAPPKPFGQPDVQPHFLLGDQTTIHTIVCQAVYYICIIYLQEK